MLFAIHCLDHDGMPQTRLAHYDAHKAYLASATVRTVISGPLVNDDGETMIGSLFIVAADGIDEVIAFNRNDPFHQHGVWKDVQIKRFMMRVDNRTGIT